MILNYYVQCIKLKTNNTKTNNPSWGQNSGSPSLTAPWCAAFPSAEAVLQLLRLAALDVLICLLLADARGRS